MAKVRVSPPFLLDLLFRDVYPKPLIDITGATYEDHAIVLDISGPDVPINVQWVKITYTRRSDLISIDPDYPPH